ncbi:MAG: tetratricopeptide repeat protein, partial [Anaerolineae bacterium]|nr:tetratricopeptide repeat protein [Anaerolineae bacterium]
MGWTYHDQGNYEKALEMFQQALIFREGNPRQIQIARWCIARTLRSLNRVEEALAIQRELNPEDGFVVEEIAECLLA